jgi:hypothetical protein
VLLFPQPVQIVGFALLSETHRLKPVLPRPYPRHTAGVVRNLLDLHELLGTVMLANL